MAKCQHRSEEQAEDEETQIPQRPLDSIVKASRGRGYFSPAGPGMAETSLPPTAPVGQGHRGAASTETVQPLGGAGDAEGDDLSLCGSGQILKIVRLTSFQVSGSSPG